jgi:hypothetical protein
VECHLDTTSAERAESRTEAERFNVILLIKWIGCPIEGTLWLPTGFLARFNLEIVAEGVLDVN